MELEILHRDASIVVVNKPAGMLVHPGREPEPDEQIAMKVVRDQIGHRVQCVHRLDRPTSGVLLFALDERIEADLRRQFEEQRVSKCYFAIVTGETAQEWVCDEPLQKKDGEPFRESSTRFVRRDVVQLGGAIFSLIEAYPETGRYHQIRKHLALGGHPIVGDYLYGEVEEMDRVAALCGQSRLMLHAQILQFFHPVEGSEVTVRASLPERFAPFLREVIPLCRLNWING